MGDQGVAYVPQPDEAEVIGARAAPPDHVQRRFLYAGRILVTGGWLVLTYAIGNRATNAVHELVGLALLLLGVFLIVLSLVASQFPGARIGAAVADAVLFYFFAPAGN